MTIVTAGEVLSFLDEAGSDNEETIKAILEAVEKYVSTYCRRTFESTSYTREEYNGRGYQIINLKQYPATAVDRVAVGTRSAIEIKNTSTGTWASAGVTATGLRLVVDGTADVTVLFADYATITAVVAAVNALGSGWSASISSSDYASFKSTDLIPQSASSCIDSSIVYLSIPNIAQSSVSVDLDSGQIRLSSGFSRGFKNVFVDYTAGYTAATMPDDLKLAVKIIVQYIYEKLDQNLFGIDLFNLGASGATGLRTVFEKGFVMPKEAEAMLNLYKRRLI